MARLGVEISRTKTHVSKDTYEFAKRWISRDQEITGLPLRGVIQNITQPKVVYTIINDYCHRLGIYISVITLVSRLYHNAGFIKKLGRMTYKRCYNLLYHYDVAVKFRNGQLTYDQLRTYLAEMNPLVELQRELLPLMRDSLFNGSIGLVLNQVNKMLRIKEDYISNLLKDIDLNDLYAQPLINSINNFINRYINKIQELQFEDNPEIIINELSQIVLPDVDKLVLQVRDVSVRTVVLDKL